MKMPSLRSDDSSWIRQVDNSRRRVQLLDGTWLNQEVLARLSSVELEHLKQSQRGSRMRLRGLDFETYGSVNLPKHGLDRYITDQYFRPLIASLYWREHDSSFTVVTLDFVEDFEGAKAKLAHLLTTTDSIAAHNAPFEKAVLDWLGIDMPVHQLYDSAVVARAVGAGSRLEAAAPQLLGIDKMSEGQDLIKLFSIPGKYQEKHGSLAFHPDVVAEHPLEWALFKTYCERDAELGYRIVEDYSRYLTGWEREFQAITTEMNQAGWPVDVSAVEEMQRRYLENQEKAIAEFKADCNADELNLNSLPQLKEWCAKRGVRASSFDEAHVEKLLRKVDEKLDTLNPDDPKHEGYAQVYQMLRTKQILGGSSLKKLQVILDRVGHDGRLRDQYLHCGAGQTLRTTGTGAQMQNLPRLVGAPRSLVTLFNNQSVWTNTDMAHNLRQVFTSSHPSGLLIVGDFSSVESRGLAWLAGEAWKLNAYRQGLDLYTVLAEKTLGVPYRLVTKDQRTFGKVGELSCGYQAGPDAVKDFAANMGVELTPAEAADLVFGWRDSNPEIVKFWAKLNEMLLNVVFSGFQREELFLKDGFFLELTRFPTPKSLQRQHPDAQSIQLVIKSSSNQVFLRRIFHGCYPRGRNVGYYKPSDRKTGDLWKNHYTDPKTKQVRFYELYGGKLTGILTQSFCRELFFRSLVNVDRWARRHSNVTPIGQFHDEIIVDWVPGPVPYDEAFDKLTTFMSDPGLVTSFPLAAEVKSDYRYIK